jgi:hypothetical protein
MNAPLLTRVMLARLALLFAMVGTTAAIVPAPHQIQSVRGVEINSIFYRSMASVLLLK